jgi:hypothetical protein
VLEKPPGRSYDSDYLIWVKSRPCSARGVPGHECVGPIEADHAGRRPLGRKCDDSEAIPHCVLAHRQREGFSGPFRDWTRPRMRAYLDAAIEKTQQDHAVHQTADSTTIPW